MPGIGITFSMISFVGFIPFSLRMDLAMTLASLASSGSIVCEDSGGKSLLNRAFSSVSGPQCPLLQRGSSQEAFRNPHCQHGPPPPVLNTFSDLPPCFNSPPDAPHIPVLTPL